jgi:hypothetical protein
VKLLNCAAGFVLLCVTHIDVPHTKKCPNVAQAAIHIYSGWPVCVPYGQIR